MLDVEILPAAAALSGAISNAHAARAELHDKSSGSEAGGLPQQLALACGAERQDHAKQLFATLIHAKAAFSRIGYYRERWKVRL